MPLLFLLLLIGVGSDRKNCFEIKNGLWNDNKDFIIQAATETEMQVWREEEQTDK